MPLAATSVATSISALPLRNLPMDNSRRCWDMSPSMATASILAWCSILTTSLVRYLVEQNTIFWPSVPLIKSSRCFSFSRSRRIRNDWSMPSPLRSSASSRKCLGFLRYSSESRSISTGMVAEKRDMTFSSGARSSMNCMSSMNPMSSMVSASSSTRCLTLLSSMVPRLRWSMSLPGVATSISTPLSKASVCMFIL